MILFLDFDGVLHPDPCFDEARLFERAPLLAAALGLFPEVAVVLSTSWRTQCAFDQLLAGLPAGLRERVIDVTPTFAMAGTPPPLLPYRRQAECLQWLRASGDAQAPWVALDDRASLFTPYCEQLVLCDSLQGFDTAAAARLHGKLKHARQRLARSVDAVV
jgi:hypothetical protein